MANRLDLNLLLTLETLLSELNVTRAAAKLNSSQPAVSAQLVRLRKMFNDPLLIPGARGMTATPRALELAPRLSELLNGFRTILQPEKFDIAKVQDKVMVATTDAVQCRLATWLSEMPATAPGLQIGFVPATRLGLPDIENLMASGRVDIAIALTDSFPDRLHVRPLHHEHFVCVMRRDHPFRKEELSLESFSAMKHVIVSPLGGDFCGSTDEVLQKEGLMRQVVVSVPNFLVAEQILLRTDFISVFPATLARERISALKSYQLPVPVPPVELAMAWHERTHPSPLHRWVREQIIYELNTAAQELTTAPAHAQVMW